MSIDERKTDRFPAAFERVVVELDWYDGPRAGVADFNGVAHYFKTEDYLQPPDEATFVLWPADDVTLQLEIEAWLMFVDWNDRYDAATATADSHPARGGINARYDEIEQLLQSRRVPPEGASRRRAQWRGTGASKRYGRSGPDYEVRWYGVDSRGEA